MGVYKNGNWTAQSIHELRMLDDGSLWLKIFYHNNVGGTVLFTSIAEVKRTNTEHKYSLIYLLDNANYKGSDGKFEFMLTYPEDTTKYNRWKQTNNPCNEYVATTSAGTGVAEGYEAVHIDSTSNYWGGLTRQKSSASELSSTYLSGSVGHDDWYYAIGANTKHGTGIPMSTDFGSSSTDTIVELWLRIDNTSQSIVKTWIASNDVIGNEIIEI